MADLDTENDLIIATSIARVLVRIKPDGTLIYGPDYTPDEAADVLWKALARRRAEATEKELLFSHMEALFLAVGKADIENELSQMRALALGGLGREGARAVVEAHRTNATLERTVHQVIEWARALVERQNPTEPKPTSRLD